MAMTNVVSSLCCIAYHTSPLAGIFAIMQHFEFIFFDINHTQTGIKFMNVHKMFMTHFLGLYARKNIHAVT